MRPLTTRAGNQPTKYARLGRVGGVTNDGDWRVEILANESDTIEIEKVLWRIGRRKRMISPGCVVITAIIIHGFRLRKSCNVIVLVWLIRVKRKIDRNNAHPTNLCAKTMQYISQGH